MDCEPSTSKVAAESKKEPLGGALCVFYTKSPFSDFYGCYFEVDGKNYYSVEHYLHIQMLFSFGLFRLAATLIRIPDRPSFRRTLRQNVKAIVKSGMFEESMFTEWRSKNAARMMKKANRAKFEQDFRLKEKLLATGESIMIFASKSDKLLGIGLDEMQFLKWTKDKNFCLEDLLDIFNGLQDRPTEMGANLLGMALMEIRGEFACKASVIYEWKHWKIPRQSGSRTSRWSVAEDSPQLADAKLRAAAVLKAQKRVHANLNPVGELVSFLLDEVCRKELQEREERVVKINKEEKRISYIRKDATRKVIGDPNDLPTTLRHQYDSSNRSSRKRSPSPSHEHTSKDHYNRSSSRRDKKSVSGSFWGSKEKQSNSDTAMNRLKSLKYCKALLNPFSFSEKLTENDKMRAYELTTQARQMHELQEKEWEDSGPQAQSVGPQSTVQIDEQNRPSKKKRKRLPGPAYTLEPGEVPPPGVIVPPPDSQPADWQPGMPMKAWINAPTARRAMQDGVDMPRLVPDTPALPAGLPMDLFPGAPAPDPACFPGGDIPLKPRGLMDFNVPRPGWRPPQSIPFSDLRRNNIRRFGLPWNTLVPAPKEDPFLETVWRPPIDPIKQAIEKARNLDKIARQAKLNIKRRAEERKFLGRDEEALNPVSLRKRRMQEARLEMLVEEEEDVIDRVKDKEAIFPFGFEKTLEDLMCLGFIPPPIIADPKSKQRNKYPSKHYWWYDFESPEAALLYYSQRWRKGTRLTTTGKEEDVNSSDEEKVDYDKYAMSSSSEEEMAMEGEFDEDGKQIISRRRKKRRRHYDTKVLFVDSAHYEQYIRWYHATHGYEQNLEMMAKNEKRKQNFGGGAIDRLETERMTQDPNLNYEGLRAFFQYYRTAVNPFLEDDPIREGESETHPESVIRSFSDYFALGRWRWAQWEKKVERGGGELSGETFIQDAWSDGVRFAGKALSYKGAFSKPLLSAADIIDMRLRKKEVIETTEDQGKEIVEGEVVGNEEVGIDDETEGLEVAAQPPEIPGETEEPKQEKTSDAAVDVFLEENFLSRQNVNEHTVPRTIFVNID